MKIVVLGGTGFLGSHVLRMLNDMPEHEAVSFSRREGIDITDLGAVTEALKAHAPDAIINCAAHVGSVQYVIQHGAELIRDNVQMAINTYEAVRLACPQAKIISPLSNCSYPGDADIYYESEWQNGPMHPSVRAYGAVKRLLHSIAAAYKDQYGIRTVHWLIPNAYGPGDYTDPNKVHALNGILIRLIEAQKLGDTTFSIWGTGTPVREWAYVEDIARLMIMSLDIEEQLDPINLAQNKGYSITEIATKAAEILEYSVTFTYDTTKADGAACKIMDDTLFHATYPDFAFTPLETGIRNTVAYYTPLL